MVNSVLDLMVISDPDPDPMVISDLDPMVISDLDQTVISDLDL
jgi:hypothetical protein